MSYKTYDAIVVGGRVAGALSAAHLAERGLSVLVLESGRFPSATLSTHFFRGDGLVRSLDRLGVLETLVFRSRVQAHAGLWPRFRATPSDERLFAAMPEDSLVRTACGPGWALVGDAGTHQDPWSGFGMDTAARQADALALAMTSDSSSWNAAYSKSRDDVTLARFHATVAAAPDLSVLLG